MTEEIQTACGVLSLQAEKETRNICGVDYPVAGWITSAEGQTLPLVDIPMMSDERRNASRMRSNIIGSLQK